MMRLLKVRRGGYGRRRTGVGGSKGESQMARISTSGELIDDMVPSRGSQLKLLL